MISVLLDSSTKYIAVAIANDGKIVDSVFYEAWQKQSELLIPELDKLLIKHNISKKDIADIIVGIGPGSYTGIRISIAVAKTISLALNVPIYAISSLHMLMDNKNQSICLINARSNRSYFAVYDGIKILIKDTIKNNEDVLSYIKSHPTYSICGDVEYLNLDSAKFNIFENMIFLKKNMTPILNTSSIKPVYLKD